MLLPLNAVLLIGLFACGPSSTTKPEDVPPLATCVPGVWLSTSAACANECAIASLKTAECDAPDCIQATSIVLRADGTSADVTLRRSDSMRSFSAVGGAGGVLDGHWSLKEGSAPELAQTFDATKTSYTTGVSCTSTRLVRIGGAGFTRASTSLAAGVPSTNTGNWTQIPYR